MQSRAHSLSLPKIMCIVVSFCVAAVIAAPAQNVYFTTLASFDGTDGSVPSGLIQATDGNFYGTTYAGGTDSQCYYGGPCGTVFKITPGGTITSLHSFQGPDGAFPVDPLVQASDGNFYGTTQYDGAYGGGTVFGITPSGTLTTLYSFCSQPKCADGSRPAAGLVQATDGNLYGATGLGGAGGCADGGCGTVFRITTDGTLTTLYSFTGGADGAGPAASLVQGTDGNLYGTTVDTVFRMTLAGVLTTLTGTELEPSGLVQAADGNFYGTTYLGGNYGNSGTVFRVTPTGVLTTLYSFCSQNGCTDGHSPAGGVVQGRDGNFYGTTVFGGAYNNADYCSGVGCGTIFKITPEGVLTTLHSFCAAGGPCPDGYNPYGALLLARDRNFYGTTAGGSTVFRVGVVRTCATCRP